MSTINKEINDPVNHPKHYNKHPSGVECCEITRHMGHCLGAAIEYIWRCDLKEDDIQDLKKAIWWLNKEIEGREERINDIEKDYEHMVRCKECGIRFGIIGGAIDENCEYLCYKCSENSEDNELC